MDEYGKVYVTYNLGLNAGRTGGFVDGSGRGVVDANTIAAVSLRAYGEEKDQRSQCTTS